MKISNLHITVANEADVMALWDRKDIDGMVLVDGEVFTYNFPEIKDLQETHDGTVTDFPDSHVVTYRKLGTFGWVPAFNSEEAENA